MACEHRRRLRPDRRVADATRAELETAAFTRFWGVACLSSVRAAALESGAHFIVFWLIKKSQQTPERELLLARKRLKEVLHG